MDSIDEFMGLTDDVKKRVRHMRELAEKYLGEFAIPLSKRNALLISLARRLPAGASDPKMVEALRQAYRRERDGLMAAPSAHASFRSALYAQQIYDLRNVRGLVNRR